MPLPRDLLTLKGVSESRVTWATYVPILVFLGLPVLNLGPTYATDRHQTDRRQTASLLNAPAQGAGHNKFQCPKILQPLTINTVRFSKSLIPHCLNNYQKSIFATIH